jgi:hypothetical protein
MPVSVLPRYIIACVIDTSNYTTPMNSLCRYQWYRRFIIACVIDTSDYTTPVNSLCRCQYYRRFIIACMSLTPAITLCFGFSLIPWHLWLIIAGIQGHWLWFIAGNNNTGHNLSLVKSTPTINVSSFLTTLAIKLSDKFLRVFYSGNGEINMWKKPDSL